MPQMAPIKWLSLFFMFSLTFVIFNVMNFFSIEINCNNKSNNKKEKLNNTSNMYFNWKW